MKLLIIGAFAITLFFSSCQDVIQEQAKNNLQTIKNQVAEDAVKQYGIAKRQGDKIQIYTQAAMAASAYLQAQDEENYKRWKAIEDAAAKDAGMPEQR